jgi:hypothetical protein
MSNSLKYTFLIYAIVALVYGGLMLAVPGRFLSIFGWAPIDPLISRLLGAAMLALAWSSFRGWQATERTQVNILIEMEVVFTVLGCLGLIRHLVLGGYPYYVWLNFAVLLVFAIVWIYHLLKK